MHPVVEAIRRRPEGARVALVIEGGGMRGAVSGGMALGLDELGLAGGFDAAYGSSAGVLNAMWLLSGRVRDGIPTWTDPRLVSELIAGAGSSTATGRRSRDAGREALRAAVTGLFAAVLAARSELHPIATEVATGRAVDLHDTISDAASLRLAIRASATLPLLAGSPVTIGGRRYLDAGLSAAIPFRAAFADGATHVLLLRSRRPGELATQPAGISARVMTRLLGRIDPAVAPPS